jgi:spore coat polysaccharide biosynthesis predicted glycosyltransferase SpsG
MEAIMNEITNITPDGIAYIDEEGNQQFIDFDSCHRNNLKDIEKSLGSIYADEEKEFWESAKYVGVRYALSDPPAVVFYTIPPIKFEFPTRESLSEVLVKVKKAGWRTNDGE